MLRKIFYGLLLIFVNFTTTFADQTAANQTTAAQTACEKEKAQCAHPLIGQFCPQCDAQGNYDTFQCSGSSGFCWCVDPTTGEQTTEKATRNATMLSCYPQEN